MRLTRRNFLKTTGTLALAAQAPELIAQITGDRPQRADGVAVLNPRDRVPVSLIIDDSTCLVNLAHFCIPHFAEVFPDRYQQRWQDLPREIPDSFVREFGEWCAERGVRGKYSIVPYPACVGWVDRDIPGWSKRALDDSLKLVRTLMMPNWDIHPEMVTHTWVIDTRTGRPFPERSERFMENWRWTDGKSVDQLADYLSYALRILKNVDLPCEGITTPGGFGNKALPQLAQASLQSVRDVFNAEIPHYFRHLYSEGKESVAPRVEYASGLDGPDPRCVVSIIGCTGDWTGGWDNTPPGGVDKFITADGQSGRMVDIIQRGEPAFALAHWTGIWWNGQELGFKVWQEVVRRLHARFDNLLWMKLSEVSRYWAAKELTRIERVENRITFKAPFACPAFTVQFSAPQIASLSLIGEKRPRTNLREVNRASDLGDGAWHRADRSVTVCFDLPRGTSVIEIS